MWKRVGRSVAAAALLLVVIVAGMVRNAPVAVATQAEDIHDILGTQVVIIQSINDTYLQAQANYDYMRQNIVIDRLIPTRDYANSANQNAAAAKAQALANYNYMQQNIVIDRLIPARDFAANAANQAAVNYDYMQNNIVLDRLIPARDYANAARQAAEQGLVDIASLRTAVEQNQTAIMAAIAAIQPGGGGNTGDADLVVYMARAADALDRYAGEQCETLSPDLMGMLPPNVVVDAGEGSCGPTAEQAARIADDLGKSIEAVKKAVDDGLKAVEDVNKDQYDKLVEIADNGTELQQINEDEYRELERIRQAVEDAETGLTEAIQDAAAGIVEAVESSSGGAPSGHSVDASGPSVKLKGWTDALGCVGTTLSGASSGGCGGGPSITIFQGVEFKPLGYCPTGDAGAWAMAKNVVAALVIITACWAAFKFVVAGLSYSRGA